MIVTELHIYKQNKETEILPKGYYFTVKKVKNRYKVECFGAKTKPYEIINKEIKPKYTLNLSKAEKDEILTMYAYKVYKQSDNKRLAPLIAMSKTDVMEIIECIKVNMQEGDEVYIYKIYATKEQGQRALKALIKQNNRLIEGDL